MSSFDEDWTDEKIVQQAVGKLPRGHNLVLLDKLKVAKTVFVMPKKPLKIIGRAMFW